MLIKGGVKYAKPKAYLLNDTGLGVAEFGARTAYSSFDKSENDAVQNLNLALNSEMFNSEYVRTSIDKLKDIEHSSLLDNLAWTYFHHSVLEHCILQYTIKGMSRGCLQEFSRHRIASPTVQSTRYTMNLVIYAYIASFSNNTQKQDSLIWFTEKIKELNVFVVKGYAEDIEIRNLFEKLDWQRVHLETTTFVKMVISKDAFTNGVLERKTPELIYDGLLMSKAKRNAGDNLKWIVTDNWAVDVVWTINLRSLKNFLELRDSGAAYFLMREVAIAIKKATPKKYLELIIKGESNG